MSAYWPWVAVGAFALLGCGGGGHSVVGADGGADATRGDDLSRDVVATTDADAFGADSSDTGAPDLAGTSDAAASDADARDVEVSDADGRDLGDAATDAATDAAIEATVDAGSDAEAASLPDASPDVVVTKTVVTQTAECLSKSAGPYETIFLGSGFEAYEGKSVFAGTTDTPDYKPCRVVMTTRIVDGKFTLTLDNRASSVYPTYFLFVDADENGRCTDGVDPKWGTIAALGRAVATANFTPKDLMSATPCRWMSNF
jgi:hypothetical protein